MNQELFEHMQKQMTPSPEVRAALSEKLAQPVKKRPVPWVKYGALAACATLMIGAFPLYQAMKGLNSSNGQEILWTHRAGVPLHSYVMVEGLTGYVAENTTADDLGSGEETYTGAAGPAPNTGALPNRDSAPSGALPNRDSAPSGALPGGAYVGDVPVQEGAEDYEKLMDHFNGALPDWYGGAYLNESGWLVVQLVEDKDPADKSLELQVLDWTGSDSVMFSSCKYSLARLKELMDRLNALPDEDMKFRDVMAGWGIDEEANRIELTLTQVYEPLLSVLAELDPDDDAIYVQVGQRARADVAVREGEDPAVYHVIPGGDTAPVPEDDENLIAEEPYYDGAHYDVEHLPEELPQEKRPAFEVNPVPERRGADTSCWFPQE